LMYYLDGSGNRVYTIKVVVIEYFNLILFFQILF